MSNGIRIVLNVESDVYADCYAETGTNPREWKVFLERFVRAGLKSRYGAAINKTKYSIVSRWDGDNEIMDSDNDLPENDNAGYRKPDTSVMVFVEELTAEAWHKFVAGERI